MKKIQRLAVLVIVLALVLTPYLSHAVKAQDPVTINWWMLQQAEAADGQFWQSVADAYTAEHPNVTIEITNIPQVDFLQTITVAMQAGDPPDLFQSWGGGVLWSYADAGLVRNIAPELEGEWKDSFATTAALELYGRDGEYYGVPWSWGAVGVFYNKALFEQAGLDPENPPTTWDEFLTTVQTLKDAGITPITLGEGEKWPGHFWWVYLALRIGGGDAFLAAYDRSGSFADEPFVKAGEALQQLIDLKPFPEGFEAMNYGDQDTLMGNGEAAMDLMGQWSPGVQRGNSASGEGLGDDLGWFPFPMVEGGAGNADDVLGGGDGFSVGANAPDETIDFLKFITNAENQRAAAAIWIVPVVKGTEDVFADNPVMQAIVEARNNAPYTQLYYDQFLPPAVGQAVNDAVETLFGGVASPEEVAAAIEDSASFEIK